MNVVVGGEGLPAPVGLAAEDHVTFVPLDRHLIGTELSAGIDALLVVSPSPSRYDEVHALALGVLGSRWAGPVTAVYGSRVPTGTDLARWCRRGCDVGLRSAADVRIPLAAGAVAPSAARRAVAEYVGPTQGDEAIAPAVLAVSELVSNALQHVGDGLLEIGVVDGEVRLAVLDPRPMAWPAVRPADPLADAGRGLGIVAAMARAWGITATRVEKAVWCAARHAACAARPRAGPETPSRGRPLDAGAQRHAVGSAPVGARPPRAHGGGRRRAHGDDRARGERSEEMRAYAVTLEGVACRRCTGTARRSSSPLPPALSSVRSPGTGSRNERASPRRPARGLDRRHPRGARRWRLLRPRALGRGCRQRSHEGGRARRRAAGAGEGPRRWAAGR